MTNIKELLIQTADRKDSDLFIAAGKTPFVRERGRLNQLDRQPFSAAEIDAFRQSVLLPEAEDGYRRRGGYDAGLTTDGGRRFRINFHSQQGKPALVARPVPSGDIAFAELGLPGQVAGLARLERGLVLVVGTAGSGKSTTMAAILNAINQTKRKHIVTIEDPIEYVHRDKLSLVTQREVGADTAGFSDALRDVVRESPDAIFIGEMRDLETMQAAINAAMTGHLVVSTLHTNNSVQCVERIVNHFPEHLRDQVADDLSLSLQAVVAQRLVPRKNSDRMIPAVELLLGTPHAASLIRNRDFAGLEDSIKRGVDDGMVNFNRALANLFEAGSVSLEDGCAAATNRDEFILLAQGMESGVDTFRDAFQDEPEDDEEDDGKLLNMRRILHSAVANNASDLIVTAGSPPYLRIDGSLLPLEIDPLTPHDTKRLLFSVLNTHQRDEFESKREIDLALTFKLSRDKSGPLENPVAYRFRVNGFYQRGNAAVAIRLIPGEIRKPKELRLPSAVVKLTERLHGLLLVTGPTGHGKSTTLASLIDHINGRHQCHIITVEDPIEYTHKNRMAVIEQREVHADTLSFGNALKYVLRQDPDVILIGEMRDPETIAAALTAAETGHLVLATLHTNSAPQTIDRIIDAFPAHQQNQIRCQLSNCLLGVLAQRLVPMRGGEGRIGVFELLIGTPPVRALIRENKTHLIPSSMETAAKDGMLTMDKSLRELYNQNLISKQDFLNLATIGGK